MPYTFTKKKEFYQRSYVHVILNGGDPAIWQYVTMRESEEENAIEHEHEQPM